MISSVRKVTSSQWYHATVRLIKFCISVMLCTILLVLNVLVIMILHRPLRFCAPNSILFYLVLTLLNVLSIAVYGVLIVRTLCFNVPTQEEESIWSKMFKKDEETQFLTMATTDEKSYAMRMLFCFYDLLSAFCCCFSPQPKHGLLYAMSKRSYSTETDTEEDEDEYLINRRSGDHIETEYSETGSDDDTRINSYDILSHTSTATSGAPVTTFVSSSRSGRKALMRKFEFRAESEHRQRVNALRCTCRETWKILLLLVCLSISCAVVLSSMVVYYVDVLAVPKIDGVIKLGTGYNLNRTVEILRDNNGIVHIKGSTVPDVLFAQGFAHAQDRIFQLEINRRMACGTLSEMIGTDTVQIDEFSRMMGFSRIARRALTNLSKKYKAELQAYTDGINAYLKSDRYSGLALEMIAMGFFVKDDVKRWTLEDTMSISVLNSWQLSSNFDQEIARYRMLAEDDQDVSYLEKLSPLYPNSHPTVVSEAEAVNLKQGSFNWTEGLSIERKIVEQLAKELSSRRQAKISRKRTQLSTLQRLTSKLDYSWSKHLPWYQNVLNNIVMNAYKGVVLNPDQFSTAFGLPNFSPNAANSIHMISGSGVFGSSSWAIRGTVTKTGKPILVSDIQEQKVTAPNAFYYNHLEVTDKDMNVIGASVPGIPHVLIGRNEHISWSATKSMTDTVDSFVLTVSPNEDEYYSNGTWRKFTTMEEFIKVKGRPQEHLTIKVSEYGPVIDTLIQIGLDGKVLALRWSLDYPKYNGFQTFSEIAAVHNWYKFVYIVQQTCVNTLSFVYADTRNYIGYVLGGTRIPIRHNGITGKYPMPGDGKYDWLGFIDAIDLPFVLNPIENYVIAASNQIIPQQVNYVYGPLGFDWDPGFKASRIDAILNSIQQAVTIEDMMTMQHDQISQAFLAGYKPILHVMEGHASNANIRFWISELLSWDGNMTLSSDTRPTVFALWKTVCVDKLMPRDSHNAFRGSVAELYVQKYLLQHPDIALECLHEVTRRSTIHKWNVAQRSKITHISMAYWKASECVCNREGFVGGEEQTINGFASVYVTPQSLKSTTGTPLQLETNYGASYRQILDMSSICGGGSQFIMPMGSSGRVFSRLYDIWNTRWFLGNYLPLRLCVSQKEYQHRLIISKT